MRKYTFYIGFLLILCGLSLLCIDHVSASIDNYYEDVEIGKDIINSVNSDYSDFKKIALEIKDDIVYVSKYLNSYLEDFADNSHEVEAKVAEIENKLVEIDLYVDNLISMCSYEIIDENMVNQCNSFKTNYKNMVNSYKFMIIQYDNVVDAYNTYAESKGRDTLNKHVSSIVNEVRLDKIN